MSLKLKQNIPKFCVINVLHNVRRVQTAVQIRMIWVTQHKKLCTKMQHKIPRDDPLVLKVMANTDD